MRTPRPSDPCSLLGNLVLFFLSLWCSEPPQIYVGFHFISCPWHSAVSFSVTIQCYHSPVGVIFCLYIFYDFFSVIISVNLPFKKFLLVSCWASRIDCFFHISFRLSICLFWFFLVFFVFFTSSFQRFPRCYLSTLSLILWFVLLVTIAVTSERSFKITGFLFSRALMLVLCK